MIKKINILMIVLLFPLLVVSQVEIVPFTGYMFGGSENIYEGKLKISDGQNYGISILKPIQNGMDVEMNYTRMESKLSFSPYVGFGYENRETYLGTNYFQLGVLKKLKPDSDKIIPFGSFSLGATWFDSSDFGDVWRFSAVLGAGLKIMLTDKIGLMARGRLMMPMQFAGVGFTVGTGGSGFSAGTYITPLQGDFTAGLIFRLGGSK